MKYRNNHQRQQNIKKGWGNPDTILAHKRHVEMTIPRSTKLFPSILFSYGKHIPLVLTKHVLLHKVYPASKGGSYMGEIYHLNMPHLAEQNSKRHPM